MDTPASPAIDPLSDLIAWIEQRLDQALTLEQVAARAGLSPYHFSRLCTARMGRSVMAYVRGRRLVRCARRLCHEPGLKLVDLAALGVRGETLLSSCAKSQDDRWRVLFLMRVQANGSVPATAIRRERAWRRSERSHRSNGQPSARNSAV